MKIEDRLNHIGELVRGLSEQNSGNMTILNSNCQMLGNRLEALEKKVQELETKTATDLSQEVISKTEIVEKAGQDAFTELRALLDEAEKDNREKYPDESMMTSILQRMREVIE